jgi:hypothetical protein
VQRAMTKFAVRSGGNMMRPPGRENDRTPKGLRVAAAILFVGALSTVTASPASPARTVTKTFAVQTVPAVKNLQFRFDGRRYVTDRYGVLRIALTGVHAFERLGSSYALRRNVHLVPTRTQDGGMFRVHKWYGRILHGNGAPRVTLDFFVPIRFHFLDPHGRRWPSARIGSVTIKRHDGLIQTFRRSMLARPLMLQAIYIAPSGLSGPVTKDAQYRIQSVVVDGVNVVHRAQQGIYPNRQRVVTVKLLFYPLRLQARDRLFATPLGAGVRLQYPDGHVRFFQFRRDATLQLNTLPRGNYVARVSAPAINSSFPIALTKKQVTKISLFSYLDAAMLGLFGLLLAVSLWAFGRLHIRFRWSLLRH